MRFTRITLLQGCLYVGCISLLIVATVAAREADTWCIIVSAKDADAPLTGEDYGAIVDSVPTVSMLVPVLIQPMSISSGGREVTASVWGTTDGMLTLTQRIARIPDSEHIVKGHFLPERSSKTQPPPRQIPGQVVRPDVVVLGAGLAAALFPNEEPLHKKVQMGGHEFSVSGVFDDADAIQDTRDRVYIHLETMRTRLLNEQPPVPARSRKLSQLWIRVGNPNPKPTWEKVQQILAKRQPGVRFSASFFPADQVSLTDDQANRASGASELEPAPPVPINSRMLWLLAAAGSMLAFAIAWATIRGRRPQGESIQ